MQLFRNESSNPNVYYLEIIDNNRKSIVGPIKTKRETLKRRTLAIRYYFKGGFRSKGFKRADNDGQVVFTHPIYSTVIFNIKRERLSCSES